MSYNLSANWDLYQKLQSEDFRKSMEDIQKSINPNFAGFMSPSSQGTAGDFWAITPEDLDPLLSTLDFRAEHLGLLDFLPKQDAAQTVVQYPRLISHGDPWMDAATAEGEIAVADQTVLGRGSPAQGSVSIKQYSQVRSITDVLAHTQLGNYAKVPREPLQFTTQEAMLALMRLQERDAFFGMGMGGTGGSMAPLAGNSIAPAPFQISGLVPQLMANGAFDNLDGSQLTMERLENQVRDLQAAPFYGQPTDILVTPDIFSSLSRQQDAMMRREPKGGDVIYGFGDDGLKVKVGSSILTVKPYIFLDDRAIPPPLADRGATAEKPAVAAYANQNAKMQVATSATSKFGAADAGFYAYGVVTQGPGGMRKVSIVPNSGVQNGIQGDSFVQVAAGQKVSFSVSADGANQTKYVRVFRTKAFATAADLKTACGMVADGDSPSNTGWKQFQYLCGWAAQDGSGAAAAVAVVDDNLERTNCGKAMILRRDPASVCLYRLINLMRLPLARVNASQPFMLLTAIGLALKIPEQARLLTNCAPPAV